MYNPSILIISKRRELAIKYKKILKFLEADVVLVNNLADAIGKIRENEFEFIIISDTIDENLKEFIKKVRILTYNFRPTIIAVSKSAEVSDKLELLDSGADDILSETMQNSEFQARLKAHIRRHIENLTDPITGFLVEKLTRKTLKKVLKNNKSVSVILLAVDKIDTYKEIYGEIASDKVYQTLGAIVSSALIKEDTAGKIREGKFLIFTNPIKAEKLAEFLAFAFDNVLKGFYSKYDYQNNFVITKGTDKEEKKVSLMKLIEAVIEIDPRRHKNEDDVLINLLNLAKSLKDREKSSYIVERPRLYGEVAPKSDNKILIMENDEALSLLIETNCQINGYVTQVCESYKDFKKCLFDFAPDLIILDYGIESDLKGILALDEAKKFYGERGLKMPFVIFSTNILDKQTILSHGADFYLPKPYDIQTLIKTIDDFLGK